MVLKWLESFFSEYNPCYSQRSRTVLNVISLGISVLHGLKPFLESQSPALLATATNGTHTRQESIKRVCILIMCP